MPIVTEKKSIASIKEQQKTCSKCDQDNRRCLGLIVCDVCTIWICKKCAEIDDKLYEYVVSNTINYNFICPSCTDELPKIKDLVKLNQKQTKMELDIETMKADIEENKRKIQNNENMEDRLSAVEEIIKNNKLDDTEYPRLLAIDAATKKIQEDLSTQEKKTTKLNIDIEEEKRKAAKSLNLIVYGLPESKSTVQDQIKSDFNTIKQLYSDRVELNVKDVSSMTRLGIMKENKIRPIRISFHDAQKRKEFLINNQGLVLEDEKYQHCNCNSNPGKHIHINVTNDKTKQEREVENKLREELKERRSKGENIIIKRGKIVQKDLREVHARWADLFQDGY